MRGTALRRLGVLLFLPWAAAAAADRSSVPLAILRIGQVEYVRAIDVAAKFGLRLRWVSDRQLDLSDAAHRVELPADDRDARIDGLRVFLGDPTVTRNGELYLGKTDCDLRLAPCLRPDWEGPPPGRLRVIAIDPGHGGGDHGTSNPRLGLMEKTFTLDVGLRLRRLLEAAGYAVVMTRTTDSRLANDQKVDLAMRGEFANLQHADLFISIHFNSAEPDTRTHGTEIFSFAPARQRSSDSWQRREDDSEPDHEHPGPSPANRNDPWNTLFAHTVHRELLSALGTEDRGEKIAHFGVLRLLHCPGILVESAFLSNDAEAERVATPAFRQRIAEAMCAGIRAYGRELDALRPAPAAVPPPARASSPLSPPRRPS
jgi:N-acetylmuramoyl-L-alanine amidase